MSETNEREMKALIDYYIANPTTNALINYYMANPNVPRYTPEVLKKLIPSYTNSSVTTPIKNNLSMSVKITGPPGLIQKLKLED